MATADVRMRRSKLFRQFVNTGPYQAKYEIQKINFLPKLMTFFADLADFLPPCKILIPFWVHGKDFGMSASTFF